MEGKKANVFYEDTIGHVSCKTGVIKKNGDDHLILKLIDYADREICIFKNRISRIDFLDGGNDGR